MAGAWKVYVLHLELEVFSASTRHVGHHALLVPSHRRLLSLAEPFCSLAVKFSSCHALVGSLVEPALHHMLASVSLVELLVCRRSLALSSACCCRPCRAAAYSSSVALCCALAVEPFRPAKLLLPSSPCAVGFVDLLARLRTLTTSCDPRSSAVSLLSDCVLAAVGHVVLLAAVKPYACPAGSLCRSLVVKFPPTARLLPASCAACSPSYTLASPCHSASTPSRILPPSASRVLLSVLSCCSLTVELWLRCAAAAVGAPAHPCLPEVNAVRPSVPHARCVVRRRRACASWR